MKPLINLNLTNEEQFRIKKAALQIANACLYDSILCKSLENNPKAIIKNYITLNFGPNNEEVIETIRNYAIACVYDKKLQASNDKELHNLLYADKQSSDKKGRSTNSRNHSSNQRRLNF